MTSLKVAVRVRPLSQRESRLGSGVVVDVQGKDILVTDVKVPVNHGCDHRVRVHRFTFDFGFWSVDPAAKKYSSQEMVYEEFGRVVLNTVLQGYNSCVIAYGPSGSGKTYTMMGSKEENGLTPRICEGLFTKLTDQGDNQLPFQIDISFMEIYNEQVFDLLQKRETVNNKKPKLRIREHPIHGPFVEGLSTHVVKNIDDVCDLLARGNECRVNAATHIHDRSSRSHAIFTIRCSQACINDSQPREVVSKLHLVDLAGSEKAAPEFCQSRVKEGGNINKSLVTLGNVISVLVELSLRSKQGEVNHQQTYVPYRDSHLTWLLKDSLGGNSHTFMLAAISPSKECYIETVSTLRYAQRAKFVLNKPVVNKDPGTEMLRNLQTEVRRLRNLLMTAENLDKKFVIKPLPDIIQLRKIMEESSRTVDLMTKHWFDKWLKTYDVVLNKATKQKEFARKKSLTGFKFGKRRSLEKNESKESLALKTKYNADIPISGKKEFDDSSECLILCKDTVGFAKKKLEDTTENDYFSAETVNTTISELRNIDFSDIKSSVERKYPSTTLERKFISNSDNILFQHSYTSPYFRFLSLDGINITYPYCNYSWVMQNKVSSNDNANEIKQTADNLKASEASVVTDTIEVKADSVETKFDLEVDFVELKSDLEVDFVELKSDLEVDSVELKSDLEVDSVELKSDLEVDFVELKSDLEVDFVELKSDSVELNSDSIELKDSLAKLETESVELEGKSVELEVESAKLEVESVELKSESVDLGAESFELEADSVELIAQPVDLGAESLELQAESVDVEAQSVEVKAQSIELEAEADELEAESFELEAESIKLEAASAELKATSVELRGGSVELKDNLVQLNDDSDNLKDYSVKWKHDSVKLKNGSVESIADLVQLKTKSIVELEYDPTEFISETVKSNHDSIKSIANTVEFTSNAFEFDCSPVELYCFPVELNCSRVESDLNLDLLDDSVELNSVQMESCANSVELNADEVNLNADPFIMMSDPIMINDPVLMASDSLEFNSTSVELDSDSLTLKSDSIKLNYDPLEMSSDSIELFSDSVALKNVNSISDSDEEKEIKNVKYAVENTKSSCQVNNICTKYQEVWKYNSFDSEISETEINYDCKKPIAVSISDIPESAEIKNPDENKGSGKTLSRTENSIIEQFEQNQSFSTELQTDLQTSSPENVCQNSVVEENKMLHSLKKNDTKFSERVNEESRQFLDLLSHLNPDAIEHCSGILSPKRKDSEVMSLLSFSSLDCPVWKSLDDFLGSSEETASIQEDDHPEFSNRSTLGVRRYSSRKASCSSIDSTACSSYIPLNSGKETGCKDDNQESNEYDFKRRNSKPFRQLKFNPFLNRVDNNIHPITDIQTRECIVSELSAVPGAKTFNIHETLDNISEEQFKSSFTFCKDMKDILPNIAVNLKSEVNDCSLGDFKNNAAISTTEDLCSKNTIITEFHGIMTTDNENSKVIQLKELKIWPDNKPQTFNCDIDSSEFNSSGLRLTKANLDLLAERLKGCSGMSEDSFETCFAYALDVNSAKGILDSLAESENEEEEESNFVPILINGGENNNEVARTLLKTEENEVRENDRSLEDLESTDFERKPDCERRDSITTETDVFSNYCLTSSLTSVTTEDKRCENGNTRTMSEGNELAKMWKQNFFEKDSAIEGKDTESHLTNNCITNAVESAQPLCEDSMEPIIEDEKDSEKMDKESESLLNNTFTSDSLDNFEQEMVNWANKYLTRNNSNSGTALVPQKIAVPQTVDANELGLDEFEFCTQINESSKNENVNNNNAFHNTIACASGTFDNNGLHSSPLSASSRSSSSDSITYVFLGTDDKRNPNNNISANMSQYSSVPSSVSLDSLERSAFRSKLPCLSPRTLSIDSLVAEELLAQLRNGELGSACKTEFNPQTQEECFPPPKQHFMEFVSKGISNDGIQGYEANITETFSPENNCSFDALNSDHNNKEKQRAERELFSTDLQTKTRDVQEQAIESTSKKLQRFSLGTSEHLVNEPKHIPSPVTKSATNSEIYKFCETSDLKLTVTKTLVTSSQSSSTSQERSESEKGRNINFEQLARNYSLNTQSSDSTKENLTDSFLVPPPTSFITNEKTHSNVKISANDRSTQTDEPFPLSTPEREQKNSLPPNTLELLLRMMEMMTETIKFLKTEKTQRTVCCGGCPHRHRHRNVRQKLDYYNELNDNFHECTSLSSESNVDSPLRIRSVCNNYTNRCFIPESMDVKKRTSPRSSSRHRRRCHEPAGDTLDENFDLLDQHHLRHTIPYDYRRKKLCLKDDPRYLEAKNYLPFTSDDHDRILPLMQPSIHVHAAHTSSPSKLSMDVDGKDKSDYRNAKLVSCSHSLKNPVDHLGKLGDVRQGIIDMRRSPRFKEKIPSHSKRLCDRRCDALKYPTPSESSSSEGYLSSISSTTTPKQISDDSERISMAKSINRPTVPRTLISKARNLKPLVLNRCPENQRAVTPNTSWQNTSADSGAFFMDSPLAENKNFCNANRSPEASNLPVQPLLKEAQLVSEKERNLLSPADTTTNRHSIHSHRNSPVNNPNTNFAKATTSANPPLLQKSLGCKKLKKQDKMEPYFLRRFDDTEEEYLDIRIRTPVGATAQTSNSDSSGRADRPIKTNSSAEEFALKISDENYNITRTDIERILASIEADKQFLRRHRNPIFERQYSPEVRVCSPGGHHEDEDRFSSDSYKSLPKPVLYVSLAKDPSLIT